MKDESEEGERQAVSPDASLPPQGTTARPHLAWQTLRPQYVTCVHQIYIIYSLRELARLFRDASIATDSGLRRIVAYFDVGLRGVLP